MIASSNARKMGKLSKCSSPAMMSKPLEAARDNVVSSHTAPAAGLLPSTPSEPPLRTVAVRFLSLIRREHSRTNC